MQIFLTFFKTMLGKTIVVELKNDVRIQGSQIRDAALCFHGCYLLKPVSTAGTLESIDQFLNFKLNEIVVLDAEKYPHLVSPFCKLDWVGNVA
jgi:small nuclear ribonucleoprotein (snRNP)-like protein